MIYYQILLIKYIINIRPRYSLANSQIRFSSIRGSLLFSASRMEDWGGSRGSCWQWRGWWLFLLLVLLLVLEREKERIIILDQIRNNSRAYGDFYFVSFFLIIVPISSQSGRLLCFLCPPFHDDCQIEILISLLGIKSSFLLGTQAFISKFLLSARGEIIECR